MSATVPSERLPLRSLLFMPANVSRFTDKAHTRGADAIVLDLEDSVAASEKAAARNGLHDVVKSLAGCGVQQIFVRINSSLRLAGLDLETAIGAGVQGIVLPKARSADHVRQVSETIAELEMEAGIPAGHTMLGVRVETAPAFFAIDQIAAADRRVSFFGLGGEDFSLAIGVEPTVETLLYPKQQAVIAAHAAGVPAIGLLSSGADFSNLDALREVVRKSRRFGFEGASCIHPAVVPILNAEFSPSPAEVANAKRVADAFREAIAAGSASINVEGKMVDYPVAYRAERVLAKHAAIGRLPHAGIES